MPERSLPARSVNTKHTVHCTSIPAVGGRLCWWGECPPGGTHTVWVYLLWTEGYAGEEGSPQEEDEGHGEEDDVAVGGDHHPVHGHPAPLHAHQAPYKGTVSGIEEESYRREGKGRRCCLGDVLKSRTSHLAARMIEEKFLEEHPFWEGCGLVWCEPEDHPFFRSIHSLKCPFFF